MADKISLRDTCLSASVVAIASTGDAFLYAWLPANYSAAGISVIWVGVILSVNRFIRLFLNGRIAWLCSRGIKPMMTVAAVLAAATTLAYGFLNALPLWLLARLGWGISFSALRLGNIIYSLGHSNRGLALGFSRSVIEMGPVAALLAGPVLMHYGGRGFAFSFFALAGFASVLLMRKLPVLRTQQITRKGLLHSWPSTFNILALVNAFIAEGVLVVQAGSLVMGASLFRAEGLALVGFLLAWRRMSLLLFAPLAGWLAMFWGFEKVFIRTIMLSCAGLSLFLAGMPVAGMMLVFVFSAMNAAVSTGGALRGGEVIREVSDNATWRDLGMAFGTLAGSWLLPVGNMPVIIMMVLIYIGGLCQYKFASRIRLRLFRG